MWVQVLQARAEPGDLRYQDILHHLQFAYYKLQRLLIKITLVEAIVAQWKQPYKVRLVLTKELSRFFYFSI